MSRNRIEVITYEIGDTFTVDLKKYEAIAKPDFFPCDKCDVKFDTLTCRSLNCEFVIFKLLK